MARSAIAARKNLDAGRGDAEFNVAKIRTAGYYATHLLSTAAALHHTIVECADEVMALEVESL